MGKLYDSQFADGRFVYSTGERISANNWIQPKQGSGRPKKGHEDLTERLLDISKAATTYIRLNRANLTKDGLKNHLEAMRPKEVSIIRSTEQPKTIVELWADWLQSIKGTIENRTYLSYSNSFRTSHTYRQKKGDDIRLGNFCDFLSFKGWMSITPAKFTITHYNYYLSYLRERAKPNTVAKRVKHFKQAMEHIENDLKIPLGIDLKKVKYKETPGLKISLSDDQLQKYIEAQIAPGIMDDIRDLWVLQCSVGPRISDLKRLDKNITPHKIILETQKTRKAIEVPITPVVRNILEKRNYQLPKVSEQRYREGIKELHKEFFPDDMVQVREGSAFRSVPVWQEISSHDAVRTFITLSHERGMSVSSIAKITGKTVRILLANYLVESQKTADKEMEKAWGASPLRIAN